MGTTTARLEGVQSLTPPYSQDYHKASRARMQEFQITLQKFHQHMEKRKDKDTSIKLKSPGDYTFKDVLEITTKLHEDHKSASQVKNCMGLIRKLFRGAGENSSILENLLNFVPNGTYGSVICGGFSMILTVRQLLMFLPSGPYPISGASLGWRVRERRNMKWLIFTENNGSRLPSAHTNCASKFVWLLARSLKSWAIFTGSCSSITRHPTYEPALTQSLSRFSSCWKELSASSPKV